MDSMEHCTGESDYVCPVVIVGGGNEVIYKDFDEVDKGSSVVKPIICGCVGRY